MKLKRISPRPGLDDGGTRQPPFASFASSTLEEKPAPIKNTHTQTHKIDEEEEEEEEMELIR